MQMAGDPVARQHLAWFRPLLLTALEAYFTAGAKRQPGGNSFSRGGWPGMDTSFPSGRLRSGNAASSLRV